MIDDFDREYSIEGFMTRIQKDDNIIIFGAGKYGLYIYDLLKSKEIFVNSIIDNNKTVLNELRDKYPVKYIEDLGEDDKAGYIIVGISRLDCIKTVEMQLLDLGVKRNKIVIPLPKDNSGFFDKRIMLDEEYCLLALREMWKEVRRSNKTHIIDYFETNDLLKILVFEVEMFKGWLDKDLKDSKVSIVKHLDKIEDYKPESECDAIVVLDELHYEVMEETLMELTNIPIISMWDIVKY